MSSAQAKRLAVLAMLATGGLTTAAELSKGHLPGLRVAFGVLLLGAGLVTVAEFAPRIGGPLAVLVTTGAVVTVGPEAFTALNRLTKKESQ